MLKSGRLTVGVVSLHRSHYLKSSALKQKVRDQQILTSGQAYDSILMQFSNSSSLIITLLPANLISHLSNFRHIPSASNFAKLRHWQSIPRAAFPKQFFFSLLFSCSRWHAHSGQRLYVWKADPFFFFSFFFVSWEKSVPTYILAKIYLEINGQLCKKFSVPDCYVCHCLPF